MMLAGKTVVVLGGTGSMGQALVRRILGGEAGSVKKIVVMSRDEGKQHAMRLSYETRSVTTDEVIYENFRRMLEFRIGDVRDYSDVASALRGADVVVNAAALKQVPICEYFPEQALLTNCIGAVNIVRAIRELELPVETVIGVSTDKACKPINVMGMTKALQERILVSANILTPRTRFVCVRYGNVMASRGSVIPVFLDQIKHGGPVTITVPEMTRFMLSLDDAVDTVFAAIRHARRGETMVPRAPAATVLNVATALIGGRNISLRTIGIRPGEKLHEIMISEEECHHTVPRGAYFAILPMLPELRDDEGPTTRTVDKEFSSLDSVVDLAATARLLRPYRHSMQDLSAA